MSKKLDTKKIEEWIALFLMVASLLLWPVSMLTFAKNEPPTVLHLSWISASGMFYTLWTAARNRSENADS